MHALQLKSSHSSWSHQNMVTSLACWGPAWLTTACSSSFYRSLPSCTFLIGHRTPCTLRRPSKDDLFMQNKTCNHCHHLVIQSETHFHYFFLMLLLKQIDLLIHTSFCVQMAELSFPYFGFNHAFLGGGELTCSIRTHGVHNGAAPMPKCHGVSIQSHGKTSTRVYKSSTHVRPLLLQSYWSQ